MVVHKINRAKKIGRIQKGSSSKKKIFFSAIILIILIIGSTIIINQSKSQNTTDLEAIAYVNNQPILRSVFENQWNSLPPQTKMSISRAQLLDQLIAEELLLQKAMKEQINVSDEEINDFIAVQLSKNGMSLEDYKNLIKSQGYSFDDVLNVYRKQLMVAKLFDQTVSNNLTPSEEDIRKYYENHKKDFFHNDEVTVRHILIQTSNQFNDSQALELTENIMTKLESKNNSNFCELVSNYSMDPGSKNTCGEYTFKQGVMVPEFENASFEMKPGEIRIVKTNFGYHIILKIKDYPEGYWKLNKIIEDMPSKPSVKEFINQTLVQETAKNVFDNYVNSLLSNATIKYVDKDLEPIRTNETKED